MVILATPAGGNRMPILPDHLRPNLTFVFCGTAVAARSASRGHYYSGTGNEFWRFLHESAITPVLLKPEDDHHHQFLLRPDRPRQGDSLQFRCSAVALRRGGIRRQDREVPAKVGCVQWQGGCEGCGPASWTR